MAILVTGGLGYIGSHTCVELLNCGHEIIIVDNHHNSNSEVLNRIEQITGKRPVFYHLDMNDESTLSEVFDAHQIDGVIHFAGYKAIGESLEKPEAYYSNNLNSTLTLCRVMKDHGVRKLVFSSSAVVYSRENTMPVNEESVTGNCTNPYGWTKYMCEQILRDFALANPDWAVVLLRYFNPVGAHESGLIGESPNGVPSNLMPYITQTAVGKRLQLQVFGGDYDTPDGTGVRDFIHVVDLANAHIAALKWAEEHNGAEVFNIGTGTGYSVLQLVKAFELVNRVSVPFVISERRPGDLAVCYANPEKSEKVLGWKAQKTLEDMCRDAWNWQKQNPNGYED